MSVRLIKQDVIKIVTKVREFAVKANIIVALKRITNSTRELSQKESFSFFVWQSLSFITIIVHEDAS